MGFHIDFERVFLNFLATAAATPCTSYIRTLSEEAIETYVRAARAGRHAADGLAPVSVQGRISPQHIDGNHRYDHVCADIRNWAPYQAGHGWLMLDDYAWSFGDGPQRAGDALLTTGDYDHAFTLSHTLFLRRAPRRKPA